MNEIISVQSSVAYGYVGNRAAVFALETLGIPVIQINTVQFSTHAGYQGYSGDVFSSKHIDALFNSLTYSGVISNARGVLSGYIGSAATGDILLEHIASLKKQNTDCIYCCDPVMGDAPHGLYVKPEIAEFYQKKAVYEADILVPNHFEACYLSGIAIETENDARRAVYILHEKGPKVVLITSYRASNDNSVGFFLSDGKHQAIVETPRLYFSNTPKGTGDLVSSLFFGHYYLTKDIFQSLELTANSVYEILLLTQQHDERELLLVQGREKIIAPQHQFKILYL